MRTRASPHRATTAVPSSSARARRPTRAPSSRTGARVSTSSLPASGSSPTSSAEERRRPVAPRWPPPTWPAPPRSTSPDHPNASANEVVGALACTATIGHVSDTVGSLNVLLYTGDLTRHGSRASVHAGSRFSGVGHRHGAPVVADGSRRGPDRAVRDLPGHRERGGGRSRSRPFRGPRRATTTSPERRGRGSTGSGPPTREVTVRQSTEVVGNGHRSRAERHAAPARGPPRVDDRLARRRARDQSLRRVPGQLVQSRNTDRVPVADPDDVRRPTARTADPRASSSSRR